MFLFKGDTIVALRLLVKMHGRVLAGYSAVLTIHNT
jgi:hypothetical protein